MASVITLPTYVIPINAILSLASLATLRYLMVFHGTIFHRMEDEKVISIVRISNFLLATFMVSYEYATSESLEYLYYFGVMTNTYSSSGGYLISIRIANSIGNVQFSSGNLKLKLISPYSYDFIFDFMDSLRNPQLQIRRRIRQSMEEMVEKQTTR